MSITKKIVNYNVHGFAGGIIILLTNVLDFFFCYEVVFIITFIVNCKSRKQRGRLKHILNAAYFLSFIPFESLYAIVNGRDVLYYYSFRLRFTIRIIEIFQTEILVNASHSVQYTGFKYICFCIIANSTISLCRLYDICQKYPNTPAYNCKSLDYRSFIFCFVKTNGLVMMADFPSAVMEGNLLWVPVVHLIIFLCTTLIIAKQICLYVEVLAIKYEFAILSHLTLKKLEETKKAKGDKWTVRNHMLRKFTRSHLETIWNNWDFLQTFKFFKGYAVAQVPQIVTKELSLDVAWNMFKHSELFKNESVHFLRNLSKFAKYKVMLADEPVYKFSIFKNTMFYVVKGTVDILSEINQENSILSLTDGSVFGELSLFLSVPSITVVSCKTFCEFVILKRSKFLKIKHEYPEVYQKLKIKAINRIVKARQYQNIDKAMYDQNMIFMKKRYSSLRYIKMIMRKYICELSQDTSFLHMLSLRQMSEVKDLSEAVFCPLYLSMYRIKEEKDLTTNHHFLKTGWFFKLNPRSPFVGMWIFFINLAIILHSLFSPIFIMLDKKQDEHIYMAIISVIWILDFISFAFIGLQVRNNIYVDFETIFDIKSRTVEFWIDFFSMFPLELLFWILEGPFSTLHFRILQANRLLKIFKFAIYIENTHFFSPFKLFIVTASKVLFLNIALITFGHLIFVISGYYYLFDRGLQFSILKQLSLICLYFNAQVPEACLPDINRYVLSNLLFLQILGFYWNIVYLIQCCAVACLSATRMIEFENLVADINKTIILDNFSNSIKNKVSKYLHFHYHFGRGVNMLKMGAIRIFLGPTFYKLNMGMHYQELLSKEGLFVGLPYNVLCEMADTAHLILIPQGELVVSADALPKEMYIIMEGSCGYFKSNSKHNSPFKRLSSGDSLLVIEVMSRQKIVHNVMTLTDCKLLVIPYNRILRKFIENPTEYNILVNALKETIPDGNTLDILVNEGIILSEKLMKNDKSFCIYSKDDKYLELFGRNRFFKHLLLASTICPYGKFWSYWETIHACITYISVFISFIPIFAVRGPFYPTFWILRLLDLYFCFDMFLRQHVFFYNRYNIEVTHPWSTARHYWTHSFIIDLISSLPFELILLVVDIRKAIYIVLLRSNRVLKFYRAYGLKKYYTECKLCESTIVVIKVYALVTFLIVNVTPYISPNQLCMCDIFDDFINCPDSSRKTYFWPTHIFNVGYSCKFILSTAIFENSVAYRANIDQAILTISGAVLTTGFTIILLALSLSRSSYLTTFQIKMQRMVNFINMRKIDKKLRIELIKYYEYLWVLREGKSPRESFSCLNLACYEEVMFAQQREVLQACIIFRDHSKSIMKDFLSSEFVTSQVYLIRAGIVKVNDVNNKIFIVSKGMVEVLGPDYTKLRTLTVGCFFGCIDDVPYIRSTLTYVARTHCELLTVPSEYFYTLARKYPEFHKHVKKLVKNSNMDFVESIDDVEDLTIPDLLKYPVTVGTSRESLDNTKYSDGKFRSKLYHFFFGVRKPNEKVEWCFFTLQIFTFYIECYQKVSLSTEPLIIIFCYLSDAIFYFYIYHNCLLSFEDAYGLWIIERKLIMKKYMKNFMRLPCHLLCVFPFEVFSFVFFHHPLFPIYWSILRTNRLFQITIAFRFLISIQNKLNINVFLVQILYTFLLFATLQQLSMICIAHTWSLQGGNFQRYFLAFGVQTFYITRSIYLQDSDVFQSLHPILSNLGEILVMLVTRCIFMLTFTSFVACYQVVHYSKFNYEAYLRKQQSNMENQNISKPLKNRVIKYYELLAKSGNQVQFPKFIRDAPYYLKEGLLDSMFGYLLLMHPVFAQCHSDLVRQIAATFQTVYFFPGDYIAFLGDMDGSMYFIYEGEVDCLTRDTLMFDESVKSYEKGDSFGFKQLFYNHIGHDYTYKVNSDATILKLVRHKVVHLLNCFPASKYIIYNFDSNPKISKPKEFL